MTSEDALVVVVKGATGAYPLDPIRLMKGAFLVNEIGREEWRGLFSFRPYDYGPFDAGVYRARDALIARGLLRSSANGRYARYQLTEEGEARATEIEQELDPAATQWLHSVGRYVTSKSFADLLREVYERFPTYAERSVFQR